MIGIIGLFLMFLGITLIWWSITFRDDDPHTTPFNDQWHSLGAISFLAGAVCGTVYITRLLVSG